MYLSQSRELGPGNQDHGFIKGALNSHLICCFNNHSFPLSRCPKSEKKKAVSAKLIENLIIFHKGSITSFSLSLSVRAAVGKRKYKYDYTYMTIMELRCVELRQKRPVGPPTMQARSRLSALPGETRFQAEDFPFIAMCRKWVWPTAMWPRYSS